MVQKPGDMKKGHTFSWSSGASPDRAGEYTQAYFVGNQVLSAPDSSSYLFQSVLSFLQGTTKVGSRGRAQGMTPSDSLRFIFIFFMKCFVIAVSFG